MGVVFIIYSLGSAEIRWGNNHHGKLDDLLKSVHHCLTVGFVGHATTAVSVVY